ncbi:hypothetical protein KDK77_04080 [bacterium]|nr:hypothetical protein [bacterium]
MESFSQEDVDRMIQEAAQAARKKAAQNVYAEPPEKAIKSDDLKSAEIAALTGKQPEPAEKKPEPQNADAAVEEVSGTAPFAAEPISEPDSNTENEPAATVPDEEETVPEPIQPVVAEPEPAPAVKLEPAAQVQSKTTASVSKEPEPEVTSVANTAPIEPVAQSAPEHQPVEQSNPVIASKTIHAEPASSLTEDNGAEETAGSSDSFDDIFEQTDVSQPSEQLVPEPPAFSQNAAPLPETITVDAESTHNQTDNNGGEEMADSPDNFDDIFEQATPSQSSKQISQGASMFSQNTASFPETKTTVQQTALQINASDAQSFLIQTIELLGQTKKELAQISIELEIERLKNQARRFF